MLRYAVVLCVAVAIVAATVAALAVAVPAVGTANARRVIIRV